MLFILILAGVCVILIIILIAKTSHWHSLYIFTRKQQESLRGEIIIIYLLVVLAYLSCFIGHCYFPILFSQFLQGFDFILNAQTLIFNGPSDHSLQPAFNNQYKRLLSCLMISKAISRRTLKWVVGGVKCRINRTFLIFSTVLLHLVDRLLSYFTLWYVYICPSISLYSM